MVVDFYRKMQDVLQQEQRCVLMVVIDNEGSSPGRKGFKMLVSLQQMYGTIGGGIMEHKLVEYCRSLLHQDAFIPFSKHQIHDKSAATDQSGMICSGHQTVAFYDIDEDYFPLIREILSSKTCDIVYTDKDIHTSFQESAAYNWHYIESTTLIQKVYIIGGGHVGLALSEVLSRLDFEIHILDHRENLNTMMMNTFAHSRQTIDFEQIEKHIPEGDDIYVVIMSFGYRTDEIIIRRLLGKKFKYIGMMGSQEKIATLYQKLIADGCDEKQLAKVHSPIGIDIKSETTQEIAISVAAQLISIKNRS